MSELKSNNVPNAEEVLGMLLITNMRMYDALLLLLKHFDAEIALQLDKKHELFKYVGTLPFIEKDTENA